MILAPLAERVWRRVIGTISRGSLLAGSSCSNEARLARIHRSESNHVFAASRLGSEQPPWSAPGAGLINSTWLAP